MRPLGLVINSRRGPIEPTYLPLDDPILVLYGLNGAGKSFVLDALKAGFSGLVPDRLRTTEISLLAELPALDDAWPNGLSWAFQAVTRNEISHYELFERLEEQLDLAWEQRWLTGYFDWFQERRELASEFARSRLFLVQPFGVEVPAWELSPAVVPSKGTPAAAAMLDMLESSEDEDAVAQSPVQSLWSNWPEDPLQPPEAPTLLHSEAYTVSVSGRSVLWQQPIAEPVAADIDRATAVALKDVLDRQGSALEHLAAKVQQEANVLYAALLRDAPMLELEVRPQYDWLTREPLRWVARRTHGDEPVRLAWLSQAESRWAQLAIRVVLSSSPTPLVILDEPEAALHRAAESHMARAVADLCSEGSARFVLSTHSPELLDSRDNTRYLVRRKSTQHPGGLVPFTGAALDAMEELGIHPSDLLRRTRAFLLVEGEHDVAVLGGWFSSEFRELGVEVLPLRGASKLKSVLDSRFLFDYTDAMLVPFLDDVDVSRIRRAWETATHAMKTKQASAVIDDLMAELRDVESKGAEYFAPFLTRALEIGRDSRVFPLGIQKNDILDYLPVNHVVPTATSWQSLRDDLRSAKRGVEPSETEFKKWLTKSLAADLSPEAIRSVAAMSTPPSEIRELIEQLRRRLDSSA